MIDLFQRTVAWLMNRVRVNSIHQTTRDEVPVFVKRRRAGASGVIWLANQFLAFAHSGICMFVRVDEWLDWELRCVRLLYPERSGVTIGPGNVLIIPKACGISLRQLLHREQATERAFAAAGRELRRAHQIPCSDFNGAWSHGDLHLDNILYDSESDRAILIDFDTRHVFSMSPTWRHADDLKVALSELLALSQESCVRFANALVQAYDDASVLEELSHQLVVPRGFAKILWYARTNVISTRHIAQRLQALKEVIDRVCSTASVVSESRRTETLHKGRPE
jgi:serine/threonine protein kinase